MPECIEREAIKTAVRKRLNNSLIIGWLIRIINDCPTADVVPVVHGRWVFGGDGCVVCSECDEEEPNDNHRNYCPNCGARMDGE